MHGSIDRSIRYLISRGSGSEDEILQEVAPREAKNGSRALGGEEQQEGEGGNGGSHVYPEGSAEREEPRTGRRVLEVSALGRLLVRQFARALRRLCGMRRWCPASHTR